MVGDNLAHANGGHCYTFGDILYRVLLVGILGGFLLILMGVITDRQTEPDCLALVYMR